MGKINVLVVPSNNVGGVGFFRSIQPHIQLQNQFKDDFEITFEMKPDFSNLSEFDKYQIIHIHRGLFVNKEEFHKALEYFQEKGIITIIDIDDYWDLNPHHPQYFGNKIRGCGEYIKDNLKRFDYVTTTTSLFADEIKKYNKNVIVFPNAIDPTDERFIINRKPSDKLRIGLIMGSAHEYDVMLLNNISNGLPSEVLEKVQFVLCGFDTRGNISEIDKKTGIERTRKMEPKENVWYRFEKMLTDDYRIVSPEHKAFLEKFMPNCQYPLVENEHYKRCWTKDINHYFEHYNEVDVLLAPLEEHTFNKVKSQLKAIECAFSHTALIASEFGPYTIDLHSIFEKGGIINNDGNAILINENKNHKDWRKAVIKLVTNPDLVKTLQDNISKDLCEKYDLRKITEERAEFYKKITNNKK